MGQRFFCHRIRKVFSAALWVACGVACGGEANPSAPDAFVGPGSLVVSGRVIGTLSGQAISGARVTIGGVSAMTDSSGSFRLGVASAGDHTVQASASGHPTRGTFVRAGGPDPVLDLIEPTSTWSVEFYRELCRDGSGGGGLKPLSPWSGGEPHFYVDRRPERGRGRPIPEEAVETVQEAIVSVLPLLTGGRLSGSNVQVGSEPPPDRSPGTVIIRWDPVEISQQAGAAAGIAYAVGGDWNVVVLRDIESTESIFHELGHVLGLYHPLGGHRPSHMIGAGVPERPHFTQWDVHHSRILYRRPPGNTDLDNDPPGFIININGVASAAKGTAALAGGLVACPDRWASPQG
jgi:hypothetical protein